MKVSQKVLVAIVATVTAAGVGHHVYLHRPLPFDAGLWAAGDKARFDQQAPRLRMADGLIRSDALIGKTKPEVLAMLGAPTQTNKFRDYDLVYWLGAERSFIGIDSEWLVVQFDESGKVATARIVTD